MENNKLIAEFMNYPDLGTEGDFSYLRYHASWDWLMPVVDKIESDDRYDVDILQYGTRITDNQKEIVNNIADISFDKKIEHTHNAVVEFIKLLKDKEV